jgi:hypothetical protein
MGDDARRKEQLLSRTWTRLLAPRLLKHAASLQASSSQVLTCWRATQALCRWLDAIVIELLAEYPETWGSWEKLKGHLEADFPLSCELHRDGWSEPVRLVGVADSLLKVPQRSALCAIELKLGQASPVVDLGQAALYHLILARMEKNCDHSALSLIKFSPELEELLIDGKDLKQSEERLLDLIGTLAAVARPTPVTPNIAGDNGSAKEVADSFAELGTRLLRACREHGIGLEVRGVPRVGQRFLRYEVRLTPGIRVESLRKRTQELQHRLELAREPMVVQDAGHLFVDIERPDPQTVLFSSVVRQLPNVDSLQGSAKVPIGVDPSGHLQFADLASSGRSHILVAGTTSSGKSEWLRMAVAGLIATNTPDTMRLVTLDPKLAAFSELERSRFLWHKDSCWIPGSEKPASEVLLQLAEEMDRRYRCIHDAGCDTLQEYVSKQQKPLARIICVCDEYFALVSQTKQEKQMIEQQIALLGAKGRAAGVHLILATQQPSRATITGAIQSNLPCRVALYLQNSIESNMILSQAGAERLTGSGDLLYKDFGNPVRLQAPYLTPAERAKWFH